MSRGNNSRVKNIGHGVSWQLCMDGRATVKRLGTGGFSLLEVMLALFILTFSLLALANFDTVAWRRVYDAGFINLAVDTAANRIEAELAHDSRQYDKSWQQNITAFLPSGRGSYVTTKTGGRAKVCWQQFFRKHKFCYEVET